MPFSTSALIDPASRPRYISVLSSLRNHPHDPLQADRHYRGSIGHGGLPTVKPSDDTLKKRTEFVLNTKVSKVEDVRSDSTITYYTATTGKGRFECQMPSGALVAAAGMGIYQPTPSCVKEGQTGRL